MSISWQDVVVVVIVIAAVGYLGQRCWLMVSRRGGGSCGCGDACPQKSAPSPTIVQISSLANDRT